MGMVSYTIETLPSVSKEDWDRVLALEDDDIDYSDIPEFKDLSGLRLKPKTPICEKESLAVLVS